MECNTANAKECGLCNHDFDAGLRTPRNLPCSHCFCTNCINDLIRTNNHKCPYCRESFRAESAKQFKVNTTALDLLDYVKILEEKQESSPLREEMKKKSNDVNEEDLACCRRAKDHAKMILQKNNEVRNDILQILMQLEYDVVHKLRGIRENFENAVAFLEKENEKIQSQVEDTKDREAYLESVKCSLKEAKTRALVDQAVNEAKTAHVEIQRWLPNFKKRTTAEEKTQLALKKSIKDTETKVNLLKEVLASEEKNQDLLKQLVTVALEEEAQGKLTGFKTMTHTLKFLTSLEGVYAEHHLKGRRRFAKLSIRDHKLLLHSLGDGLVPPDTCVIKHSAVMKLDDPSSRLTFLQLGNNESTFATLYIRLQPGSVLAQNFLHLCTGDMGPSYKNTKVISIWTNRLGWKIIRCGDYEFNDGLGGKSLFPFDKNSLSEEISEVEEGSVILKPLWLENAKASQFGIVTRGWCNGLLIGNVEMGLQTLIEFASHTIHNADNIRITECGVTLQASQ